MSAARATQTKADKADNELILYRLGEVEKAVRDLSDKVSKQDNIKKSDLLELRDTIVGRVNDVQTNLQKQIDTKADKASLDDIKKIVYGFAAFFSTVLGAYIIWAITRGH